jgi:hypothetical protein
MKIGSKYLTLNRNITKVENDLKKLSGDSGIDDIKSNLEIFQGKTDGKSF